MKSALRVTSLIASEEDERLAFVTAKSLFLMDQEPYPSQSITWKRSVGLGVGVVCSVSWLLLVSFLSASKSPKEVAGSPIVYIPSDYTLTNAPLYAYRKEPQMIP